MFIFHRIYFHTTKINSAEVSRLISLYFILKQNYVSSLTCEFIDALVPRHAQFYSSPNPVSWTHSLHNRKLHHRFPEARVKKKTQVLSLNSFLSLWCWGRYDNDSGVYADSTTLLLILHIQISLLVSKNKNTFTATSFTLLNFVGLRILC